MHSECTILMQISQNFPGETPGPPPAGGGYPLPQPPAFGATRLSEAFGFIGHLCPPGSGGSGSAPGRGSMNNTISEIVVARPGFEP